MNASTLPSNEPDWLLFEQAVARFVQALEPTAKVTHNARLPDTHTDSPRQRDVWVEIAVLGHKTTILISCKRYKEPLNQQDIDHFNGERQSSGANMSVLYSYSGFNDLAIQKAKVLGIQCCRLYQNQPADMPEVLVLKEAYLCQIQPFLYVNHAESTGSYATWKELFDIVVSDEDGQLTVFEYLCKVWSKASDEIHEKRMKSPTLRYPEEWSIGCEFKDNDGRRFVFGFGSKPKFFRGRVEAVIVDGSYSITSKDFIGTQLGPFIDTQSSDPGPGWEVMDSPPPVENGVNRSLTTLSNDMRTVLTSIIDKPLPPPPPDPPKVEIRQTLEGN